MLLGHSLQEQAPPREQVLPVGRGALGQPEQVLEARFDEGTLGRVGDELVEHPSELREGRLGRVVLGDPCPHANHLRKRPVGDPVAVREAAAAVPPRLLREPVDVLLELPGEPRLADPGDPDDREEVGMPFFRGRMEHILREA